MATDKNGLTDKERTFALAVADGKTQHEAYKIAYQPKTENRNTIDVEACKIAKRDHVRAYIQSLRDAQDNVVKYANINDKQRRIELIWERIDACIQRGDDAAIARYTEQLAKLNGDYVNITKNIEEKPNVIGELSTDQLKELLDTVQ